MGGQSGQLPTEVLADQLTLYQPEGADCAHHPTSCPPSFRQLPTPLQDNIEQAYIQSMYSALDFKQMSKTGLRSSKI